jgi:hypothetical protein
MLIRTFVTLAFFTACFSPKNKEIKKGKATFETKLNKMSATELDTTYSRICRHLEGSRKKLTIEYSKATNDDARENVLVKARTLLFTTLSDSIFVCWYGTNWDFNGITTSPRQGNIACGYFVTTTLLQGGFLINRVFLAQQASSVLIKAFCPDDKIKTITNHKKEKVLDYLKTKPDGIFILGLDNHVGFVLKNGDSLDFVHSSFWPQHKVVRVPLASSEIFNESGYFMIGELLYSDTTITKWVKGEKIPQ